MVFKTHWAAHVKDLPPAMADIKDEYFLFLEQLVKWMEVRRKSKSKRLGLAMLLVRTEKHIFSGVGVYTVEEIFHKAGMSVCVCLFIWPSYSFFFHLENFFKHSSLLGLAPNITEREVFDNPSRTARLVAAYYDYTHNMRQTMWYVSSSSSPSAPLQVSCEYLRNFVKPFLHGFLLACSRKDRILYSNHLMVHGKKRTNISQRSKDLLIEFEVCVPIIQACRSSPLG